jgi:hypothetical protein
MRRFFIGYFGNKLVRIFLPAQYKEPESQIA